MPNRTDYSESAQRDGWADYDIDGAEARDPVVTRHPVTAAVEVSDIIDGQLIIRRYYGYTLHEARAAFLEEFAS